MLRDPRAQRSRAALIAALWEELRANNPAPTITELVARAGVSRPTFYQHYTDVPELMRATATARLRDLLAASTSASVTQRDALAARLRALLTELHRDRSAYLAILLGPAAVAVLGELIPVLAGTLRSASSPLTAAIHAGVDAQEAAARAEFISAGVLWRVLQWLRSEDARSLADVAERLTDNLFTAAGVCGVSAAAGTADIVAAAGAAEAAEAAPAPEPARDPAPAPEVVA